MSVIDAATDNPFATRYTRPGAVPFDCGATLGLDAMIARLRRNDWWGEIVGPHGVGKSTLLASLLPRIEPAERSVVRCALHDGQRRLPPAVWTELSRCPTPPLLVIDGYEQLGGAPRWLLKRRCRRLGWGVLATGHRPLGLPPLVRLTADPAAIERIVAHLQARGEPLVSTADVRQAAARRGDDVRELLFDLYRLHESRSRRHRHQPQRQA